MSTSLTIDGIRVSVPEGTLLVEAAKRVQADVPVYCYHPKLGPAGLCRVCLVEVEGAPKLQIACNTQVTEGMVVRTRGAKTEEGRRAVLEFLLLNHPLDCPICDKGGECDLQDFSIAYGQGVSRKIEAKDTKPKAVDLGPTIVLDEERCIVCQRCTRFDDIITAERSLVVKERGYRDCIATAVDAPYRSDFSGNVTELCPVGALTSKTYRFVSRPWDLRHTASTCTQCAVGCQMRVDVRHGNVLRTMSVPEDDICSDGWLCDRGRYNVGFLDDGRRLTAPMLRSGREWAQISWDEAIVLWARKIKETVVPGGARSVGVGVIGGGRLTNEEVYLAQHVFRGLGIQNLDWRAGRQREAIPPGLNGTFRELERAQTIVVLGVPPAQTAPVMDLRIRKAVTRHAARLFRVGDHASQAFVPETCVESVAAIPPEAFTVERLAVVWDGIDVSLFSAFSARIASLSGGKSPHVVGYVPGEQGNARGAETLGMVPRGGGLDTRAMFEYGRKGMLRVLSLFGVNPVLRYADAVLAREGIEKTPFVVVSELFMTQTAQRATLVLPARAAFEKEGHTTNLTGEVLRLSSAVPAPAGTLPDGDMLVALAAELGVEIPTPGALRAAASALIQPGERRLKAVGNVHVEAREQLVSERPTLRIVISAASFSGGGTLAFDPRLGALRMTPTVTLSARTADDMGLVDSDVIDVVAGERRLCDLIVRVREHAPVGTVTIIDGLPDAPANIFSAGEAVTLLNRRSSRGELAGATV
jgi:NADH-quinone oxidoreductase subunit G